MWEYMKLEFARGLAELTIAVGVIAVVFVIYLWSEGYFKSK